MTTTATNHPDQPLIEHEIARIFDNNGRFRRETPNMEPNKDPPQSPPLASPDPELMDEDDDHQNKIDNKPYPGIDDGFFSTNHDHPDTDIEILTNDGEIPEITSRAGGDGGDETDAKKPLNPEGDARRRFPLFPDLEIGTDADGTSIPDVNVYQHKKTLAQGMMDLALFSANANQLRYVIESGNHPYFYPSFALITISLLLQVAVGIGLIWNATFNVHNEKQICIANKINNFTVIGIFLVTVVNVFISAFGVSTPAVATNST